MTTLRTDDGARLSFGFIVENTSATDTIESATITYTLKDADGNELTNPETGEPGFDITLKAVLPGNRSAVAEVTDFDDPADAAIVSNAQIRDAKWWPKAEVSYINIDAEATFARRLEGGKGSLVQFDVNGDELSEPESLTTTLVFHNTDGAVIGGVTVTEAPQIFGQSEKSYEVVTDVILPDQDMSNILVFLTTN